MPLELFTLALKLGLSYGDSSGFLKNTTLLVNLLVAGRPSIFVRIGVRDGSVARHASFTIRGHNDPLSNFNMLNPESDDVPSMLIKQ